MLLALKLGPEALVAEHAFDYKSNDIDIHIDYRW
jgi:hypothetical protein